MKVAVINSSFYGIKPGDRIYNLAVDKIANFHLHLGDDVYSGIWRPMLLQEYEKVFFSVIFTWDIPKMIEQANHARTWGKRVEIGGPAATFMAKYIETHTGITPHLGLDDRYEHVPGNYKVSFSSRGCPHSCKYCGVSRVEPNFLEYVDYPLASMIGDNNILGCTLGHQQRLVARYKDFGEVDINSGFDVRFFTPEHFELYSQLRLKQWRFAFDSMDVEADVRRVASFMKEKGFDRHKCTFYCLIGFPGTTPEECRYRLETIIALGMNPYPMRYWPLNRPDRTYLAPGWTRELVQNMTVFYQTPNIWMTEKWEKYKPGKKDKNNKNQEALWNSSI